MSFGGKAKLNSTLSNGVSRIRPQFSTPSAGRPVARNAKSRSQGCERLLCGLLRRSGRKDFASAPWFRFRLGLGSFLGFFAAFVLVSHALQCDTSKGSVNREQRRKCKE